MIILKITPVNSSCIMSSGKMPKESSPHSCRNDCHTLKRIPLLISFIFDRRSSTSTADNSIKSSAGFCQHLKMAVEIYCDKD